MPLGVLLFNPRKEIMGIPSAPPLNIFNNLFMDVVKLIPCGLAAVLML